MPSFTFDVKCFATVHMVAKDEARAREAIDDMLGELMQGNQWRAEDGTALFVNAVSTDGEHELVEVDGEPAP